MKCHWISNGGLPSKGEGREGKEGRREQTKEEEGRERKEGRRREGKDKPWRSLEQRQMCSQPCTVARLAALMPSKMQKCGVGSLEKPGMNIEGDGVGIKYDVGGGS